MTSTTKTTSASKLLRPRTDLNRWRRDVLSPAPFPRLLAGLTLAILALCAGGQAHAQALGSVHCKASLRNIDVDLKATERKLSSVQNGSVEAKCSAMKVHVLTLERASEVFGRCMEGSGRDENVGQADASAADFRDQMAKTCG